VEDKLRPRILAGQPPSMAQAYLPFWTLVLSDQLLPFDPLLDRPLADEPGKTFRDTIVPGSLDMFTYRGKTYALPIAYNAWVFWYSRSLFERHGWRVPETWGELDALCDAMHAAGLDPIAFQGKYGIYSSAYFWHLIQSCAGMAVFDRIQAMDAEAFGEPGAVEAARRFQELGTRHFQKGSLSMSHTEAQTEFCLGHTGLVSCGLYFENEMRHAIPAGFELGAFAMPPVEGGRGQPGAIFAGPLDRFVCFKEGPHPEIAMELAVHMLSVENMTDFAGRFNTLSPIMEANERADLSPVMRSVRDMLEKRPVRFCDALESYAQTWDIQYRRPLTDQLIRGTITPEDYVEQLARGLAIVRDDPRTLRPSLEGGE
jgi:N-acetylglucosamine transport system substrate-binding protein